MVLSINTLALQIVKKMILHSQELRINVETTEEGATIVDAGLDVLGGYTAGRYMTEICLGGLGEAVISDTNYNDFFSPSISVMTDFPAISLLGSQLAGWQIKVGKYFAMGSGPARALSLKPKDLYEKIGYYDKSSEAVIVLETMEKPTSAAINLIAENCGISTSSLYIVLASTSSIAGSTQVSGRSLETGLHKLVEVGFDPNKVLTGYGSAPIAPIHPKFNYAMGRTNDMIIYGGYVHFTVDADDDLKLKELVDKVPSSLSRNYGKPFAEVFKEAGNDFYKIDPLFFAPAMITVNNKKTGAVYTAGCINTEILKKSIY